MGRTAARNTTGWPCGPEAGWLRWSPTTPVAREVTMNVEVVEFELVCRVHGVHRVVMPAVLLRPRVCAQCHLPAEVRELSRFTTAEPPLDPITSELFIG